MHGIDHNAGDEWALAARGVCDGCASRLGGVDVQVKMVCRPHHSRPVVTGILPVCRQVDIITRYLPSALLDHGTRFLCLRQSPADSHFFSSSSSSFFFSRSDPTLQHSRSSEGGAWAPRAWQSVADEVALQLAWLRVVSDAVSYRECVFSVRRRLLAE